MIGAVVAIGTKIPIMGATVTLDDPSQGTIVSRHGWTWPVASGMPVPVQVRLMSWIPKTRSMGVGSKLCRPFWITVYIGRMTRIGRICRWRGRPEFACNLYPLAFSVFRPLVRGRTTST